MASDAGSTRASTDPGRPHPFLGLRKGLKTPDVPSLVGEQFSFDVWLNVHHVKYAVLHRLDLAWSVLREAPKVRRVAIPSLVRGAAFERDVTPAETSAPWEARKSAS